MSSHNGAIAITGIGLITAFGVGRETFWDGLVSGRSTAETVPWLRESGAPVDFACAVKDDAYDLNEYLPDRKSIKLMSRAAKHAVAASSLAIRDADLQLDQIAPERAGVVLGTGGVGLHDRDFLDTLFSMASEVLKERGATNFYEAARRHIHPLLPIRLLPNMAAAHLAISHGLRGENMTVCTACTSGTQSLGEALRILRDDRADVMLAGGTDAMINPVGMIGFGMLGVLSRRSDDPTRASRPFDKDRDGFVMGEGAAIFVLERMERARRRGARILGELAGYGVCADAYRVTDEREDGSGPAEAMRRAMADANVDSREVDYVNAHGTGTVMNDRTEVRALRDVFGDRIPEIPISSTKSQIGHLLAAAGAVEAAACVEALRSQTAPPTINFHTPDSDCEIDVVPNAPRPVPMYTVLSNSFGFGGQNACVVLRGAEP